MSPARRFPDMQQPADSVPMLIRGRADIGIKVEASAPEAPRQRSPRARAETRIQRLGRGTRQERGPRMRATPNDLAAKPVSARRIHRHVSPSSKAASSPTRETWQARIVSKVVASSSTL